MLDIVILAAGKGTRMRSDLPKVLHTLANKPFLFHVIDRANELKPEKIHIVVGHGAEIVEEQVRQAYGHIIDKLNFVEQAEQLGTGHAVMQALPQLSAGGQCLVLYGDVPLIQTPTLVNLNQIVDHKTIGLLTVNFDDPTGYGRIIRNHAGAVEAIIEQKDASENELLVQEVNSGIMAFDNSQLHLLLPKVSNNNAQSEYYLTDLVKLAREENFEIKTAQPKILSEVAGVNNREQQMELERIYQKQIAKNLLDQGVAFADSSRFDCRGVLTAGKDCFIDINCVFEGEVVLGDGVVIESNCVIRSSNIGDGCRIKSNTIIEESECEANCDIGPFARIRPGTRLAAKAKIGNFVETKKAAIGEGSKVNHLSYVGDAVVGKDVNIGAGTITCNYDGANKSITELDDNVFVGSNTALVAPIKVKSGATIGAGSVITAEVNENQLAVTRAKQRNIDGWERPTKRS